HPLEDLLDDFGRLAGNAAIEGGVSEGGFVGIADADAAVFLDLVQGIGLGQAADRDTGEGRTADQKPGNGWDGMVPHGCFSCVVVVAGRRLALWLGGSSGIVDAASNDRCFAVERLALRWLSGKEPLLLLTGGYKSRPANGNPAAN